MKKPNKMLLLTGVLLEALIICSHFIIITFAIPDGGIGWAWFTFPIFCIPACIIAGGILHSINTLIKCEQQVAIRVLRILVFIFSLSGIAGFIIACIDQSTPVEAIFLSPLVIVTIWIVEIILRLCIKYRNKKQLGEIDEKN